MTAAALLRERAESYGRDMMVLKAAGDPSWTSYMTIRDELRKVADEVDAASV